MECLCVFAWLTFINQNEEQAYVLSANSEDIEMEDVDEDEDEEEAVLGELEGTFIAVVFMYSTDYRYRRRRHFR